MPGLEPWPRVWQRCQGCAGSDPAPLQVRVHTRVCVWFTGVCARLCGCARVYTRVCVHWWLRCRHTRVRARRAAGVRTRRSPRAAAAGGFPALGCARGGLGAPSCSSAQQKRPPLRGHRAGAGPGLPRSPAPPRLTAQCCCSVVSPCQSTPGLGGHRGHFGDILLGRLLLRGAGAQRSGVPDCSWPPVTLCGSCDPSWSPPAHPFWIRHPHPSCSTLGGGISWWCSSSPAPALPCALPVGRARAGGHSHGQRGVGRGWWAQPWAGGCGKGLVGTAVGRGAQQPFVPLKPPPRLSADPESQRKRTVQNVLDLRQNLEETMSSLRGSQVSHR